MFYLHSVSGGHAPAFEYHRAGDISPKAGMALIMKGGVLTMPQVTERPDYICMIEGKEGKEYGGEIIPAVFIEDSLVFSTTNSQSFIDVREGDCVQLSDDAMQVTSAKTNGKVRVVRIDNTEVGSEILVRFE